MGDFNGKVGTGPDNDAMGAFGVLGENDSGKTMKDKCNEKAYL